MATIIEIIDQLCLEKGIKGSKLCDDIGISRSTLTELRKGRAKTLSIKNANKIANYFNVSVEYLLGTNEQKEIPADKGSEDEDDDFVVLARHMKKIPEKERQRIIKNFRETVDMYLEVMGITDDKDKEGK